MEGSGYGPSCPEKAWPAVGSGVWIPHPGRGVEHPLPMYPLARQNSLEGVTGETCYEPGYGCLGTTVQNHLEPTQSLSHHVPLSPLLSPKGVETQPLPR